MSPTNIFDKFTPMLGLVLGLVSLLETIVKSENMTSSMSRHACTILIPKRALIVPISHAFMKGRPYT